jgi:N4-gp56 family major capsid protein
MALTTVQSNNKLLKFTTDINREFVRENLFSPYMGEGLDAIIRVRQELKSGGEQMNIPLVTKLRSAGKGVGTLVGNEENVDSYGMRVWLDWRRNAVVTNRAEVQKDSIDLLSEFKPLLTNWGKEYQRDDLIAALMALPSTSAPAGLGSDAGQPANGLLYEASSAAQKQTWSSDNSDRILFGTLLSNRDASTYATSLSNIADAQIMSKSVVSLAKRIAMQASPAIRPFKTADGYEWYVMFCGSNAFRDLKNDLATTHTTAYQTKNEKNVIFQDGDLMWDGVIIRQVPEISGFVTDVWTSLLTAGASSHRVEPYWLCGQQAAALCWGQMARPTELDQTDYGFRKGVGIEMAYGTAKMFKLHPANGTKLVQWGVMSGFIGAQADA